MRRLPAVALLWGLSMSVQAAAPCPAPEYRQFDFWIGQWKVSKPDGTLAGHNTVDKVLDGCALHESWRGARGSRGHSYSMYDASKKTWHQTWVDTDGLVLLLDGKLDGGNMVLSGATRDDKGETLNRVTWTPQGGGKVRQLWETSPDAGKTWAVAFDGLYEKQP
jgi:hypothetical protein